MSRLGEIRIRIRERIPEARIETYAELGQDVVVVERGRLVDVLTLLRDEAAFTLLSDLSAVDWLPREPRYDVNYHLYSFEHNDRLRVKVQLPGDDPEVASVAPLFRTAEWHEREAYDFFGIVFGGHPDLRRILMPEEWIGHPLRKDYPVGGVPVEYKIEPAYMGEYTVSEEGRPAAGGIPARLHRDRGRPSHWTWSGPPASGVRIPERPEPPHEDPREAAEAPQERETGSDEGGER